jgi:hypothetical protein
VTAESAAERTVVERQRNCVTDDDRRAWHAVVRDRDHSLALVDRGHLPLQMLG